MAGMAVRVKQGNRDLKWYLWAKYRTTRTQKSNYKTVYSTSGFHSSWHTRAAALLHEAAFRAWVIAGFTHGVGGSETHSVAEETFAAAVISPERASERLRARECPLPAAGSLPESGLPLRAMDAALGAGSAAGAERPAAPTTPGVLHFGGGDFVTPGEEAPQEGAAGCSADVPPSAAASAEASTEVGAHTLGTGPRAAAPRGLFRRPVRVLLVVAPTLDARGAARVHVRLAAGKTALQFGVLTSRATEWAAARRKRAATFSSTVAAQQAARQLRFSAVAPGPPRP